MSRSKKRLGGRFTGDEVLRSLALKVWDTWEYMNLNDQVKALTRLAERAAEYGYEAARAELVSKHG